MSTTTSARARRSRRSSPSPSPPSLPGAPWSYSVFAIPLSLTLAMLAITLLPRVAGNAVLTWSFWGAGAALIGWQAILAVRASRDATFRPAFGPLLLKPQHYIQAICQFFVFAYWGWYWRPVYDFAPLLAAQLLFAYGVDLLIAWSRREKYSFGMGPFPIVFSTNLFLWFRDDWFSLQFALIAVGFLGKALVRWQRDGRRVHIFNPSAFTLAIFSLVLLATDSTHLTWGPEIASTFGAGPRIYLVVFTVGLVVMYFFSITPVTAAAAATLFGSSVLYTAITGVPYFVDSDIPAAVFLGLHLLVTDPTTSPRTPLGRLIFGVLYGLGVLVLYWALGALGLPTFYDKLLCVPLLNLTAPSIDRAVAAIGQRPLLTRLGLDPPLGRMNLAHMGAWALFFVVMTMSGGADGMHRGDSLPFWQQACADGRRGACEQMLRLEATYCNDNAGWACNELGRHYVEGRLVPADLDRAFAYFSRACEARFQPGCLNLLHPEALTTANPRALDLRLLVREGGLNLVDMPEPDLYTRACRHGWSFACDRLTASR